MPLFAVPQRMMGAVIGSATTASSLGMALGAVPGGWIFDTFSSYAWLFIGAFSPGIGAFLATLAFRPLPRRERVPGAPRLISGDARYRAYRRAESRRRTSARCSLSSRCITTADVAVGRYTPRSTLNSLNSRAGSGVSSAQTMLMGRSPSADSSTTRPQAR